MMGWRKPASSPGVKVGAGSGVAKKAEGVATRGVSEAGSISNSNSNSGAGSGASTKARDLADWYYEQVRGAEQSKLEGQKRLTRIAWRVAGGAMACALVAILGATVLVEYRRPEPPVILRDNTVSGEVDVLDVARSAKVSWGEAEDRADLRRYVAARESYDWETIQDMYDRVKATTCGKELDRYQAMYDSQNPNAPQNLLKNQMRVIARAGVIAFVGSSAQVFFEKRYVSLVAGTAAPKPEYGVATISYEHRDVPGKRSALEANPTGFCVTSYTPERDWTRAADGAGAPAAASAGAVPPATQASNPAAALMPGGRR